MSRLSLYIIIVHFILLVFFLATMLLGYGSYKRGLEEHRLVESYAPRMQDLCDLFEVEIQIKTYDDLLKAFERLVEKTASSN